MNLVIFLNYVLSLPVHAKATTENNTLYASSKSAIQGLVNGLTIEKNEKMSIFELILVQWTPNADTKS